jgi:hypothetical protein
MKRYPSVATHTRQILAFDRRRLFGPGQLNPDSAGRELRWFGALAPHPILHSLALAHLHKCYGGQAATGGKEEIGKP